MGEERTIIWTGKSGKEYRYLIYEIGTDFRAVAGNYIFSKEDTPKSWVPIYIGQTDNLNERFDNHHKMPCIRRNGGTHIHVHTNERESDRLAEEKDLIAKGATPCND